MFPVSLFLYICLVWLVTERGGEEGDSKIRRQIVIDQLWSSATTKERHGESKTEKGLCDIHLRLCLDVSIRPLPSLLIYWTLTPRPLLPPLPLSVQQWSCCWVKWVYCWRCWTRRSSAPPHRRRRALSWNSCSRYSLQVRLKGRLCF